MSDKDKHIMYSSSDIERYLRGELSAPEMHALERAALDDPFLADALDGMALHRLMPEQPVFSEDVAELQERLESRVAAKEKGKTRKLPLFMRYAAVVILLVGVGLIVLFTLPGRRMLNVDVARTVQPSRPAAPVAEAAVPPVDSVQPATGNADVATNSRPLAAARKKDREALAEKAAASQQYRPAALNKTGRVPEKEEQDKAVTLADGQKLTITPSGKAVLDTMQLRFDTLATNSSYSFSPTVTTRAKAPSARVDHYFKSPPADQLVFSGKVIDQNNHPLPGAFLALKNNVSVNATTDKNGYFNLRLNNKLDTAAAVVVNYVGYEQASLLLNTENKKGNVIQLQPQSASLNEVVITGYGAKRREIMRQNIDARQKALSLVAVPADGWPAYNNYLELNKPSASLDSTIRGDETISFIVNNKGELSSFKVEQSISPAHDSATIHMIKQGPTWKLLSGKKARARVILTY